MPDVNKVSIIFKSGVNQSVVSVYTLRILSTIGEASGNFDLIITSTIRTPEKQASVMFNNCRNLGETSQRKLYGRFGDMVIDVYEEESKDENQSDEIIIRKMMEKIFEIGPTNVSKHCADPAVLNVVDIPFSCLTNKNDFLEKLKSEEAISKYIDEPSNQCVHVEIPQR